MKNLIVYLIFIFTIVFLFGFAYSFNRESVNGKTIFVEKKCNSCHSVEVASIEGKKKDSVDLSKVGDKYNTELLAKFLTKKEKIDDQEHKTVIKGTDEEITAVTEWLSSLKSKKE